MAANQDTAFMTRREFVQQMALVLKDVMQPRLLANALHGSASRLGVAATVVYEALASVIDASGNGAAPAAAEGKKKGRKKKGEAEGQEPKAKRAGKINTYTLLVTWFLDFANKYGKHPRVEQLRAQDPELKRVGLAAAFYKTIPDEKKKQVADAYTDLLKEYNEAHMGPNASAPLVKGENKLLETLAAFEKKHPERSIGALLDLKPSDKYKSDPAPPTAPKPAKAAAATAATTAAPAPAATVVKKEATSDDEGSDEDESSDEDDDDDEPAAKAPAATATPASQKASKKESSSSESESSSSSESESSDSESSESSDSDSDAKKKSSSAKKDKKKDKKEKDKKKDKKRKAEEAKDGSKKKKDKK